MPGKEVITTCHSSPLPLRTGQQHLTISRTTDCEDHAGSVRLAISTMHPERASQPCCHGLPVCAQVQLGDGVAPVLWELPVLSPLAELWPLQQRSPPRGPCPSLSLSPGRCPMPGAGAALVPHGCPAPRWGSGTGPGCQALP